MRSESPDGSSPAAWRSCTQVAPWLFSTSNHSSGDSATAVSRCGSGTRSTNRTCSQNSHVEFDGRNAPCARPCRNAFA